MSDAMMVISRIEHLEAELAMAEALISQLEAETKRLIGVCSGYEAVINRDLTPGDKVRFLNAFYARGGSSINSHASR